MASPEVIDIERLLASISEEQPAGPELRADASHLFYELRDARNAAREAERRLREYAMLPAQDREEMGRPEPSDWRRVERLACDAIAEKSKDLWAAAWLVEALTRLHGFAGLRDGFRLTRELCERFWEGINPPPDEDGILTTVSQLAGLNGDDAEGVLVRPIGDIPITGAGSIGPLTGNDYVDASELQQKDPESRAQRIDQGAVTLEMFQKAVDETPAEFFQQLLEDINQAFDEYQKLTEVLEQRCGTSEDGYPLAPPSSNIRNALVKARDQLLSIARHVLEETPSDKTEETAESRNGELPIVGGEAGEPSVSGKVRTREDAFRALLQVADYFRRTEPHSPVSYALEQAVRWGRMSLPELMNELIPDESSREELFRRTGIRSDSENSD